MHTQRMTNGGMTSLLTGIGIGAGLMYGLDPNSGRRRRALARDKVRHALNKSEDAFNATVHDMGNRLRGLAAAVQRPFLLEDVPDEVIAERVREKLGHYSSHPHAIEVRVEDGQVTLRGPILADEVAVTVAAVARVRDVRQVVNQLEVHQEAGDVPGLQGGRRPTGERFELMQANWSPTARVLAGLAALAMLGHAARRGGLRGTACGAAGLALLGRAGTNRPLMGA
jgi:hypothetical protein